MKHQVLLGWVRDQKGRILHRPPKTVCNAITSFSGGGKYQAHDGLAPTAPHILYTYN